MMVYKANQPFLSGVLNPTSQLSDNPVIHWIYNHDILHCTAKGVEGNHLYSARALGMTNPGDLIQLHPALRSEWRYICEHYARVGLEHATEVIWNTDQEQLGLNPEYQPSVFFFGEEENRVHRDQGWLDIVSYINSKNNFIKLAEKLGVPVPKTYCFDRADEINAETTEAFVFPCYLKAAISVSGVGIHRCESAAEMLWAANDFDPATPVQVQEEVKTDCFLNMQYESINGECRRLLTTEQILDGPVHQGNLYPARAAPWKLVEPMAEWLAERDFKEIFAFDVAVIEEGTDKRYLAIECNPRFNGASYPTAIALKLDIPEWEARNFKTWHKSLAEIDLNGLEYNNSSGEGVIIVNWGPVLVGKIMIMLAGSAFTRQKLEVELRKRLW
ncbi:MAG: ATP-grasp domain-containing protein [Pseudomonadota bacterium]